MSLGFENVEYEPEAFPGLVYRMADPKVVLMLFGSGKMVCVGAREVKPPSKADGARDMVRAAVDARLAAHVDVADLDEIVPAEQWEAVAEIVSFVMALKERGVTRKLPPGSGLLKRPV